MGLHQDFRRLSFFFGLVATARSQLDSVRYHLLRLSTGPSFGEFLDLSEEYFRQVLAKGDCGGENDQELRECWRRLFAAGALPTQTPDCWLEFDVVSDLGLGDGATSIILMEARLAAVLDCRARIADPLTTYLGMLKRVTTLSLAGPRGSGRLAASMNQEYAEPVEAPRRKDSEAHRWMTPTQASEAYILAHPRAAGSGQGHPSRQRRSWTVKTRTQFEAAARLLEKSYGARPLCLLEQADILRLDQHFRRLPASHHKWQEDEAKTLEDLCVEAEHQSLAADNRASRLGLSIGTTNRHYRFLRMLCSWMASQTPSMARLDWSPLVFRDARDPRAQRAAIAPVDGRKLFTLPPWRGSQSERRRMQPGRLVLHDAGYWVIPIAWYTGMRREEICKLLVSDFEREDGMWFISVKDTEAGRTKNLASHRIVPLASELIRLGLPQFVQAKRSRGEAYLFAELVVPGRAMGDVFYKAWWRRFRDHAPTGTTIHSIRHMVADELKFAGVSEEERADLLGHKLQSETAGRYSKATRLARMRAVVDTIPIATSSLRAEPIRLRCRKNRSDLRSTQPSVCSFSPSESRCG